MLLIGSPPFFLMVNTPSRGLAIQPEHKQPETRDGTAIFPSVSRDGKLVAYARVRAAEPRRVLAVSTYSITEHKPTDYTEGDFAGAIAITPDGSKLAYSPRNSGIGGANHIHIIDLKTRQDTTGPEIPNSWRDTASWSPDSKRLAYNFNFEMRVWDSETGRVTSLGDGGALSWSPSGEWIAYFDSSGYEESTSCSVIIPTVLVKEQYSNSSNSSAEISCGGSRLAP
jgi:Tol biopolymer transport system component